MSLSNYEILKRIDQMQIELGVMRSQLTPKRKRSPRKLTDQQKEINEYVKKLNLK